MITVLAILALAPGAARLALFVALHLVRSDYAVGRTRTLSTVMTWITAAFWGALALCVWAAFPQ